MKRIELNHWFIDDNDFSIALLKYHVSIKKDEETGIYVAEFTNYNMDKIKLNFNTIEDAVTFVESKQCSNYMDDLFDNAPEVKKLKKINK